MYEKMYFRLFNSITEALLAMEEQNYGVAMAKLRQAQRDCEETYICWDEAEKDEKEQK